MEKTIEEIFETLERIEKRLEKLENKQILLSEDNLDIANAVKKELPLELQRGDHVLQAIYRALMMGIIEFRAGYGFEWKLQSKTLLAYFCGRVWCGDYPKYDKVEDKYLWFFGEEPFPEASLNKLFRVTGLRLVRHQRNYKPVPVNHQLVDNLV